VPPTLDIRSVNVATAAVSLAVALAMVAIKGSRRTYPGFGLWAGASACLSAAMLLLAAQGVASPVASVVVGNLFVALRYLLVTAGLERFLGARTSWPAHAAGLAAVLAASVLLGVVYPATTVRILLVLVVASAWAGRSAWLVLRRSRAVLGAPSRLLLGALLADLLWGLARASDLASRSDLVNALPANAPWQAAFFVTFAAVATAQAFGLVAVDMQRLEADLRASREALRVLQGIIPICAGCKRVREGERWTSVEAYVAARSEAEFSHGMCPDCVRRLYPDEP
jgi:hypothetical protein